MRKLGKVAIATLALAGVGTGTAAVARGGWMAHHPRRAEVNRRLENQGDRIQQGVRSGELTRTEAHQLGGEDRSIRHEERSMARLDGGHITKADQKALNQQENQVSKQIYSDKHD